LGIGNWELGIRKLKTDFFAHEFFFPFSLFLPTGYQIKFGVDNIAYIPKTTTRDNRFVLMGEQPLNFFQ
jgi:hypothetical protein